MDSTYIFDEEEAFWLFVKQRPTLQDMASFRYALSLWSNVLLSGKFHNYKDELQDALVKTGPIVIKIIRRLPIPQQIKDILQKSIGNIKIDLLLWMIYHYDNMLPHRRITLYTCHFKWCVWKSNGDIDYKESARSMISNGNFAEKEIFEIMSKFCMEDELYSLSINNKFREYVKGLTLAKHPLSYYWICVLTGRLFNCPWRECGDDFMKGILITCMDVDNWHSINYFWKFLSVEDQVTKAVALLSNPNTCWFLRELFWSMNESQRCLVFEKIPVDLIVIFFRQFDESEKALFIWMRSKHMFIGEQFSDLIRRILKEKLYRETAFPLSMQVWNTADDHLKKYVLDNHSDIISDYFSAKFVLEFDEKLQFLHSLLSFTSVDQRAKLFLGYGATLTAIEDFSLIKETIELCLPKAEDVVQFKQYVEESASVEENCTKLFIQGKFAYLDEFFETYLLDKSCVVQYKMKLLKQKEYYVFIFEPTIWSQFEKFVDGIGSHLYHTTDVKKQLICSFRLEYFNNWTDIEQLNQLENVVALFLTSEETVELKRLILDTLECKLTSFSVSYVYTAGKFFDGVFLTKIISWCLRSGENVADFKHKLPIDNIFDETIHILMRLIRCEDADLCWELLSHVKSVHLENFAAQILIVFDLFLKWYFVEIEEVKKYKLRKIFAFDNVDFFAELVTTATIDEYDTKELVMWFLDHDDDQIHKFKLECNCHTISKII